MSTLSDDSDATGFSGSTKPLPTAVLEPRSVHLRDRVTTATIYPVFSPMQLPFSLMIYLSNEYNAEIERGQAFSHEEGLPISKFQSHWFGSFAAVMLKGEETQIRDGRDWTTEALGTFYCRPNYPGRCSHICSASFLVANDSRNQGVGKLLAEAYLDYAPKLGYTYSIFDLVFETSTASLKIWDALGFKRIGRVKGAARLAGHENKVDAIIYGRDLGEDDEYVSDERFDKIRYYLEKGKYPPAANRSEKSRLRSAATHYRLDQDKLMLKDKEVVSDPQRQYEIARNIHAINHGGINKTTANIAEKYHWVQIKKTVSQVIRNCTECKEHHKSPPGIDLNSPVTLPRDDASSDGTTVDMSVNDITPTPETTKRSTSRAPQARPLSIQTVSSRILPNQYGTIASLPTNPCNQTSQTSGVSTDALCDPDMMENVRRSLQQDQEYHHHHHHHHHHHSNIVPTPRMHENLLNMSPTSANPTQRHFQIMQGFTTPQACINQTTTRHQLGPPLLHPISQRSQRNPSMEELMLDEGDDDMMSLQPQLFGHSPQDDRSMSSLTGGDQPGQHALQKLAAELQGSHDTDIDLYTL